MRSAKAGRGCRISRLRERSSRLRLPERDEVYGRSCGFAAKVAFAFKPLHLLRSCALSIIIRQNRLWNKTFCHRCGKRATCPAPENNCQISATFPVPPASVKTSHLPLWGKSAWNGKDG